MKAIGIEKAARRLAEAKSYLPEIRTPKNVLSVHEVQDTWYKFLVAITAVPEILRTSARNDPKSRQWMGGKDGGVLKDPLLQYIKQARGSDYHGLEAGGAEPKVTGAKYLGYEPASAAIVVDGVKTISGAIVLEGDVSSFKFEYALVPVHDERHSTIFAAPTEHLGKPLADTSPAGAAEATVAFYEQFLREAAQLVR